MAQTDQGGTEAPSEEYNAATGLQNVDESVFVPDDGQAEETPEQPDGSETPSEQPDGQEETPGQEGDTPDEGSESEEGEEQPEAGDEKPEDSRLLAGTFKNEQDLRAAFENLGGDPDRYKSVAQLEEAYEVRRAEWTRAKQQYNEVLNQNQQPQNQDAAQSEQPMDRKALADEAYNSIDWNNVKDAPTAIKAAIDAVLGVVDRAVPKGQQFDENAVITRLNKVQQSQASLAKLEKEVPRLTTDQGFRDNFAAFIMGQQKMGTYTDPETSFRQFMGFGRNASQVQSQRSQETKRDKLGSAIPDKGNGAATSEQKKRDEVDDIIDAFQERKNIFG